jgi:hypothetical protein
LNPYWSLKAIIYPIIINGANPKQTSASGQQYIKPAIIPVQSAANPSNYGPNISVQAPFNKEVSEAMAEVSTLGPLSLLSKNPIFFYKIFEYNSFLIE